MAKEQPPTLRTPEFRGSFVNLAAPRKVNNDDASAAKYSMLIVLPKDKPETKKFIAQLEKAIEACCVAKFNKILKPAQLKHYPIKDGDANQNENVDFSGHWTIPASNKFKPGVIDSTGADVFEPDQLYSGAWYRAAISVWGWNNPKSGKGVSINLNNVLKVRDDDAFTGRRKASSDFEEFIKGDETADAEAEADGDDLFT